MNWKKLFIKVGLTVVMTASAVIPALAQGNGAPAKAPANPKKKVAMTSPETARQKIKEPKSVHYHDTKSATESPDKLHQHGPRIHDNFPTTDKNTAFIRIDACADHKMNKGLMDAIWNLKVPVVLFASEGFWRNPENVTTIKRYMDKGLIAIGTHGDDNHYAAGITRGTSIAGVGSAPSAAELTRSIKLGITSAQTALGTAAPINLYAAGCSAASENGINTIYADSSLTDLQIVSSAQGLNLGESLLTDAEINAIVKSMQNNPGSVVFGGHLWTKYDTKSATAGNQAQNFINFVIAARISGLVFDFMPDALSAGSFARPGRTTVASQSDEMGDLISEMADDLPITDVDTTTKFIASPDLVGPTVIDITHGTVPDTTKFIFGTTVHPIIKEPDLDIPAPDTVPGIEPIPEPLPTTPTVEPVAAPVVLPDTAPVIKPLPEPKPITTVASVNVDDEFDERDEYIDLDNPVFNVISSADADDDDEPESEIVEPDSAALAATAELDKLIAAADTIHTKNRVALVNPAASEKSIKVVQEKKTKVAPKKTPATKKPAVKKPSVAHADNKAKADTAEQSRLKRNTTTAKIRAQRRTAGMEVARLLAAQGIRKNTIGADRTARTESHAKNSARLALAATIAREVDATNKFYGKLPTSKNDSDAIVQKRFQEIMNSDLTALRKVYKEMQNEPTREFQIREDKALLNKLMLRMYLMDNPL